MKPMSIKLGIHEISVAHTAENLETFIKKVLKDFSIWERVFYYAVDNASVMQKCFKNMKKEFIGCFNHLLHLIFNRFLDLNIFPKKFYWGGWNKPLWIPEERHLDREALPHLSYPS